MFIVMWLMSDFLHIISLLYQQLMEMCYAILFQYGQGKI